MSSVRVPVRGAAHNHAAIGRLLDACRILDGEAGPEREGRLGSSLIRHILAGGSIGTYQPLDPDAAPDVPEEGAVLGAALGLVIDAQHVRAAAVDGYSDASALAALDAVCDETINTVLLDAAPVAFWDAAQRVQVHAVREVLGGGYSCHPGADGSLTVAARQ